METPDEGFYRRYMGGWNFIAYYLLKEIPRGADPLGPENVLVFATGAITGAPIGGAGRSHVGAKSPLTGGFGESDVGGWWGAELARAGYDAIVVKGRAERPVYLWLKDGEVEIRPAEHLWGALTADAQETIREELGDGRVRVAQIGPAGERLSPIAAVMHDVTRAAGRTGLGAVMGSKNLKAVAVRGTRRKPVADRARLQELARWYNQHFPETWGVGLQDTGTANGVYQHTFGGLPTRNFQEGAFDEGWEAITGDRMRDTILVDRDTCFACPVRCKRVVDVTEGPFTVDPAYGGPEYETVGALGSNCGIADLAAIARANQLCNAYGLDTISCGVTISWAMECFERGLLTAADTGGIELRFGDASAMVHVVELMGKREGFGELLGEGSRRASERIGRGTEQYAMHVKGLEIPMHEPRVKHGLGVGYVASPTGADHMHNFHDRDFSSDAGIASLKAFGILEPLPFDDLSAEKMQLGFVATMWRTLHNVLGMCVFAAMLYDNDHFLETVRAITGWETSLYELLRVGERAYTLGRAFDVREGVVGHDELPQRFFEPFAEGTSEGQPLPEERFAEARSVFYRLLGWDAASGIPEAWKLHALGVGWAVEAVQAEEAARLS